MSANNNTSKQQHLEQVRALFGEVASLPAEERSAALQERTQNQATIDEVLELLKGITETETANHQFEQRIG